MVPKPGSPLILGMVNTLTEWLFAYPDRYSVTISGADRLLDVPREDLAKQIWAEIAAVANLAPELPSWQIVKEKRATFAATPVEAARRAGAGTRLDEPRPRRRLDGHRPALDDRGGDPLGQDGGARAFVRCGTRAGCGVRHDPCEGANRRLRSRFMAERMRDETTEP